MRIPAMVGAAALAVMVAPALAQAAPMNVAPLAPATSAPASPTDAPIRAVANGEGAKLIFVRGGCGYGEHRSFRGYCHYNRGWRGRARFRSNHWRRRHWY